MVVVNIRRSCLFPSVCQSLSEVVLVGEVEMTASISHHETAFGLNVLNSVRELQQQGLWCDAKIRCNDGRVLCVHRILLSAVSPYFREKFAQQYVEINVDFSSDVMTQLVKYCYSGEISISTKISLDVYLAARKFQLDSLLLTTERHILSNLESAVNSQRFAELDADSQNELLEHLPMMTSKQLNVMLRGLVNWLEHDQPGRIMAFASIMMKLGKRYVPREYYNVKAPLKAVENVDISASPPQSRTRYMVLHNDVYTYTGEQLHKIDWQGIVSEREKASCELVVPLCKQAGLFLTGRRKADGYIRLDRHWFNGSLSQGDVRSVSSNQMYAVDCTNSIRSLRVNSGLALMADTGKSVPESIDRVFNISADDCGRLLIYGSNEKVGKTLTYARPGPELVIEAPDRLGQALDIVHIAGTQIVYQVWSGHIEEMHITAEHSLPRWPKRMIFLPKESQVNRVLHPFCDQDGLVVLVQDVWSSRQSILRYSRNQWEILLQQDAQKLEHSVI